MSELLNIRVLGQPQLEKIIKAFQAFDTKVILDEGAAVLFNRMRTRFLRAVDPEGKAWPVSKAAMRRAAGKSKWKGGRTLYASGKLFRGLELYAESSNTRAIGTNVTSNKGFMYPKMHQLGLGIFPRRQFLGFGKEDIQVMSDVVIKRLTEAMKV